MAKIEIEGRKYRVVDDLNFVPSVGAYVKEVETPTGKKKAIKRRGSLRWQFWTVDGRLNN